MQNIKNMLSHMKKIGVGVVITSSLLGSFLIPSQANAQATSVYSTNCNINGTGVGNNAYAVTCGSTANSTIGTSIYQGSIAIGQGSSSSQGSEVIGTQSSDNGNGNSVILGSGSNNYDANNVNIGTANTIGTSATNGSGANIDNMLVGFAANLTGQYNSYMGALGIINGNYNASMGYNAQITGNNNVGIGPNVVVTANNSVAIGSNAQATSSNSIALGQNSITDGRTYELSIGNSSGAAFNRVLTGLAPGTQSNDAATFGQLTITNTSLTALAAAHGSLVQATAALYQSMGGGAALDTGTLAYTSPVFTINGTNYTTVSSALQALETQVSSGSGSGSTTDPNAVHYNSASQNSVTFTNLSLLSNVQAGIANTDAMNVGQGQALAQALGGGAVFTGGILNGPIYNLNGTLYNNVGSALTGLQNEINNISSSGSGSTSSTDANSVHYDNGTGSGSVTINGTGQIHGVQAGTSVNDAANVGQVQQAQQTAINTSEAYTDQQIQNVTTKANPLAVNYTDASKTQVQLNQNNANVTVSGVADGVQAHDAVNVEQLNATLNSANNYTNQQVTTLQNTMNQQYNAVNGRIDNLDKRVDGVAAMALSSGNVQFGNAYEQNQLSIGVASFRGAVGGTLSYTRKFNDNLVGNLGLSGATNAGGLGVSAKMGYSW